MKRAAARSLILGLLLFLLSTAASAEGGDGFVMPGSGAGTAENSSLQEEGLAEEETRSEEEGLPEGGIPVLSLTVDPAEFQAVLDSKRHSYQAGNCTIRIDVPEGYVCEYGEPDTSLLGCELPLKYFRGRGNSTWLEDKKPFKFRLEESADLLSMGANEHWVLLANAKDESLLRNRLMGYIGDAVGLAYTSKFVPVDLVVNGVYQGSYLLGEQVRTGENRIEIDKIGKKVTDGPELGGGYLLSMAPTEKDPEEGRITLESGLVFLVETPDFTEYDDSQQEGMKAQLAYIAGYLQRVEDAVFGEGFRNAAGESAADLMDLESAAKYWWVQTFALNDDGFASTSTYLYKERDGKLYWGPLWDFDRSFWMNTYADFLNYEPMPWLDHLRENDPEYRRILREVWDELDGILQEVTREGGVLDRYAAEIRDSWMRDRELWSGEVPDEKTFERTVEDLREMIELRRAAVAGVVDTELSNVYAKLSFEADGKIIAEEKLFAGETLPEKRFPQAPEKEGAVFLNWADETGRIFNALTRVGSDMKVHAVYETGAAESGTASEKEPEAPGKTPVWLIAGAGAVLLGGGIFLLARKKKKAD